MIMADVYVPSIGRQYDFSLDEQAQISHLIQEIAEVIGTSVQNINKRLQRLYVKLGRLMNYKKPNF